MSSDIQVNLYKVLNFLYKKQKEVQDEIYVSGEEIKQATDLTENQINDAVELLRESGLVEWYQTLGTAPYNFNSVLITARGKYEVERRKSMEATLLPSEVLPTKYYESLMNIINVFSQKVRPPIPIGSPYGFTDKDWESVCRKKAEKQVLYVVLGCKFESSFYATDELKKI